MPKTVLRRPYTVAKCAQTLDGKVATANGRSQWITSPKARDFARRRRDRFRAIMVGAQTALKDNPRLTGVRRRQLIKIVVDSTLRVSPKLKIFSRPDLCWLATTRAADARRIARFQAMGVRVLLCPRRRGRVHLPYLWDVLRREGVDTLLVEGGPILIGQALRDQLIDRLDVYIAPKIMGDAAGLDAIVGLPALSVDRLVRIKNYRVKRINPEILVEADVYRNR